MVTSGGTPPTVDALRRVRRGTSTERAKVSPWFWNRKRKMRPRNTRKDAKRGSEVNAERRTLKRLGLPPCPLWSPCETLLSRWVQALTADRTPIRRTPNADTPNAKRRYVFFSS